MTKFILEGKPLLNFKFNASLKNNEDMTEVNQFVGEFIGLMSGHKLNEGSEYHSLFCCTVNGLYFDFCRIQAKDQYFRQLFANDKPLEERLEFIQLTDCMLEKGLDFRDPSDRLKIIKILAKIGSEVK